MVYLLLIAMLVLKVAVTWFTREDSTTKSVNFSMIPAQEPTDVKAVKETETARRTAPAKRKAYPEAV